MSFSGPGQLQQTRRGTLIRAASKNVPADRTSSKGAGEDGTRVGMNSMKASDLIARKKHHEEMLALARGLSEGIHDLEKGRLYKGYDYQPEEDDDNQHVPLSSGASGAVTGSSPVSGIPSATKAAETLTRREAEILQSTKAVHVEEEFEISKPEVEDEEEEEEEDGSANDDDTSSNNSFLDYDPRELEEAIVNDNLETRITLARAAIKNADKQIARLNTEERYRVAHSLNIWFQGSLIACDDRLAKLKVQEETDIETFRICDESLESLRDALSKGEMDALCKMNEFGSRLKDGGSGRANKRRETENLLAGLDDRKTKYSLMRSGVEDAYRSIDATIKNLKAQLSDVNRDIKDMDDLHKESTAPKASDLLQIIADQQEEVRALSARQGVFEQRIKIADACKACALQKGGVTRRSELNSLSVPVGLEDEVFDLMKEVKDNMKQKHLVKRMQADEMLKYQLLDGEDVKGKPDDLSAKDFYKQQSFLHNELETECKELNGIITHLKQLRESQAFSDLLTESINQALAAAQGVESAETAIATANGAGHEDGEKRATGGIGSMLFASKYRTDHGEVIASNHEFAARMGKLVSSAEGIVDQLMKEKHRIFGDQVLRDREAPGSPKKGVDDGGALDSQRRGNASVGSADAAGVAQGLGAAASATTASGKSNPSGPAGAAEGSGTSAEPKQGGSGTSAEPTKGAKQNTPRRPDHGPLQPLVMPNLPMRPGRPGAGASTDTEAAAGGVSTAEEADATAVAGVAQADPSVAAGRKTQGIPTGQDAAASAPVRGDATTSAATAKSSQGKKSQAAASSSSQAAAPSGGAKIKGVTEAKRLASQRKGVSGKVAAAKAAGASSAAGGTQAERATAVATDAPDTMVSAEDLQATEEEHDAGAADLQRAQAEWEAVGGEIARMEARLAELEAQVTSSASTSAEAMPAASEAQQGRTAAQPSTESQGTTLPQGAAAAESTPAELAEIDAAESKATAAANNKAAAQADLDDITSKNARLHELIEQLEEKWASMHEDDDHPGGLSPSGSLLQPSQASRRGSLKKTPPSLATPEKPTSAAAEPMSPRSPASTATLSIGKAVSKFKKGKTKSKSAEKLKSQATNEGMEDGETESTQNSPRNNKLQLPKGKPTEGPSLATSRRASQRQSIDLGGGGPEHQETDGGPSFLSMLAKKKGKGAKLLDLCKVALKAKKQEQYEKDVEEIHDLHTQSIKLGDELEVVERQIKTVKGNGGQAADVLKMFQKDKDAQKKTEEVPAGILELRQMVGKKQHELKKLRQIWWQKKPKNGKSAAPDKRRSSNAGKSHWEMVRQSQGMSLMDRVLSSMASKSNQVDVSQTAGEGGTGQTTGTAPAFPPQASPRVGFLDRVRQLGAAQKESADNEQSTGDGQLGAGHPTGDQLGAGHPTGDQLGAGKLGDGLGSEKPAAKNWQVVRSGGFRQKIKQLAAASGIQTEEHTLGQLPEAPNRKASLADLLHMQARQHENQPVATAAHAFEQAPGGLTPAHVGAPEFRSRLKTLTSAATGPHSLGSHAGQARKSIAVQQQQQARSGGGVNRWFEAVKVAVAQKPSEKEKTLEKKAETPQSEPEGSPKTHGKRELLTKLSFEEKTAESAHQSTPEELPERHVTLQLPEQETTQESESQG